MRSVQAICLRLHTKSINTNSETEGEKKASYSGKFCVTDWRAFLCLMMIAVNTACQAATGFLWISCFAQLAIDMGWVTKEYKPELFHDLQHRNLNIEYLKQCWRYRQKVFPVTLLQDFFLMLALIFVVHVVSILRDKIGRHRGAKPIANVMVMLFSLAAVLPALKFLENIVSTYLFNFWNFCLCDF